MSQYYSIRVGSVHEENLEEWLDLLKKLKSVGLLDDVSEVIEINDTCYSGIQYVLFQAVLHGDPNPERYIDRHD